MSALGSLVGGATGGLGGVSSSPSSAADAQSGVDTSLYLANGGTTGGSHGNSFVFPGIGTTTSDDINQPPVTTSVAIPAITQYLPLLLIGLLGVFVLYFVAKGK